MRLRRCVSKVIDSEVELANQRWLIGALSSLVILLMTAGLWKAHGQDAVSPSSSSHSTLVADYGKLPLSFEANQGQASSNVRFLSRGRGYSLLLTSREAVLVLSTEAPRNPSRPAGSRSANAASSASLQSDVIRMEMVGSSNDPRIHGRDPLPGIANYFIGNDPSKWRSGVPTYGKVDYQAVYPGIDLVYYGNQRQLEYDFVVAAGANPRQIRLRLRGAGRLRLQKNGDLRVIAHHGEITLHAPAIYQTIDGRRQSVEGRFTLVAKDTVKFELGTYNRKQALVIDPVLGYSTFLGNDDAAGSVITVDSSGNAYITGTFGTTFPTTTGAFQTTDASQGSTAFIAKLNASGTELIYSTYLGGSGDGDWPWGIKTDSSGNAYVAGQVYSTDFPVTSGAFQTTNNGGPNQVPNCFVTKLNPTGTALVYSTYLGGSGLAADAGTLNVGGDPTGGDGCYSLAIDSAGDAYLGGPSWSTDFPTTSGAFQATNKSATAGANGFVAELNPAGSSLLFSTYLGGTRSDGIAGIALDSGGNVYVDGAAGSTDFPITPGAYQSVNKAATNGFSNAFVTKLNSTGSALVFSTYLGGSGNPNGPPDNNNGDVAADIAVDASGDSYLFGVTFSNDFPVTSGSYQTKSPAFSSGFPTAFAAKLNPAGTGLVYSTYVGSGVAGASVKSGMVVDSAGDLYFTGSTTATNYPVTSSAFQATNNCAARNCSNAILTELNPAGSALLYSTYLGGSGYEVSATSGGITTTVYIGDAGEGLALDQSGGVYVTGQADSPDFPISAGVYQTTTTGGGSAFVAKLGFSSGTTTTSTTTTLTSSDNPQILGDNVTFTASVTPASGTGVPTGTVTFSVDGGTGATETLNGSGEATYSSSALAAGPHTIVASYSGDTNYSVSSGSLTETITGGTAANIAIVSGSGQTAIYGSVYAVPLVVLVKDASGNPVAGAVVTFSGTGVMFSGNTATTGPNGEASVTATAAGTGSLTASAGTTGVSATAAFALTATKAVLTFAASSVSIAYGQAIPNLTYTVKGFVHGDTAVILSGSPSETTTATQGSAPGTYPVVLAQGTLAAANYTFQFVNGTLTVTALGITATPTFTPVAGTYPSAQSVIISDATADAVTYYTTDATTPTQSSTPYSSAISVGSSETLKAVAIAPGYTLSGVATAAYTINTTPPSFTFAVSPASATISSSQSATFTLTVTPVNGFAQTVAFNCAGLPSSYGCSFSPSSVTPAGSAVTSTFTIAPSSSAKSDALPLWGRLGTGLAVALLLWPANRRRMQWFSMVALLAVIGVLATGCGSGSSSGSGKSTSYVITISASGGGVSQNSTIDLTVTP